MDLPKFRQLSPASKASIIGVVVLLGGLVFTVNTTFQKQETRGRASTGVNALQNASFENASLSPWTSKGSAGSVALDSTTAVVGLKSAKATITSGNASNPWNFQMQQNVSLVSGATYTASFYAKASTARKLQVTLQSNNSPYTTYKTIDFNLTTSWQPYSFTYTSSVTNASTAMWFNLAHANGQVWLDNMAFYSGSLVVPTNTPAPTVIPPTPTRTPTPTIFNPTPTPTQKPSPTVGVATVLTNTPTPIPTVTLTPTPIAQPTTTSAPTATPVPGATQFALTLALHGLGNGGDSVNPNGTGNFNLVHPQKSVSVEVYNSQNQLELTKQGTVAFDTSSGLFKGTVDIGNAISTGFYIVKIKLPQYLRSNAPGIQNVTAGATNTIAKTVLLTGDINGDNVINILDYNILMGCYSDFLPPVSCNTTNEVFADITDDGFVNQFDYNLFLRELISIGGQ